MHIGVGACSAIVWKLPTWNLFKASLKYLDASTMKKTEYEGTLLGFDLVIFGAADIDYLRGFKLIIRKIRGSIYCKAVLHLQMWSPHGILHVEHDWKKVPTSWPEKPYISSLGLRLCRKRCGKA